MKNILTSAICLLLIISSLCAQQDDDFYTQHWAQVHQYEMAELPKSALEVVSKILEHAKHADNTEQHIKALIYQSKFALTLEENAQLSIVNNFKKEIANSTSPATNVLEGILANIYWQYFQQNRWQFYNRTQTAAKVDQVDFRTWDLQTLFEEIHLRFQRSLENEDALQQTALDTIDELLETSVAPRIYRPTLYDFLIHNALNFYKTDETHLSKPALTFDLDEEKYFNDLTDLSIETPDSLSLQYHALKLYQKLEVFHSQDADPSALIHARIERLRFVSENAHLEHKNELKKEALKALRFGYLDHPASTLADFEIASILFRQSSQEINKGKQLKKTALEICREAIQRFPESLGAEYCQNLEDLITSPSLNLMIESHIPVDQPSRLLITYMNIDSLHFYIYPVTAKEKELFHQQYRDSAKIAFINQLSVSESWNAVLPYQEDYEEHSTEVVVPKLQNGNYLILATVANPPAVYQIFAYTFIQVTDLALIENSLSDAHRFQVVDRNTGKPIPNAQVHLKNDKNHNKRINKKYTTDGNGFFEVKKNNYYSGIQAQVTYQNDRADFGSYYINQYHGGDDQRAYVMAKAFLFTDRSIYRPGQTVYFKGILIRSDQKETAILPGEWVEVYLENVNGEKVGTQRLQTNAYGSFSGEFKLPSTGLNGEYSLYVEEDYEEDSKFYDDIMDDFHWSQNTISVEEYKRPRFEVTFKPITDTYQVNDTIRISGSANAYSGTKISHAQVTYRVHRKIQFPMWYYWHRPSYHYYSEPQEIAHGELTTDAGGDFTINFRAIPDEDVAREDLPVFEYEVTADVLDINGETRSETSIVKVGYHTLLLNLQLADQLNRRQSHKTTITTKNLNGQSVPATGTLSIYKLEAPDQPKRERPWPAPDSPMLSETEFKALFPNEPYTNETPADQKAELVLEQSFDTEKSTEIELKPKRSWELGKYLVELRSEDKFGQEVIEKKQIQLVDPKSKDVADNQLFVFETDKNQYQPGDEVNVKIGSASEDMTVTVDIEKHQKIVETHVIRLSNEVKELKIPVTGNDSEGFAIQYSFVNYNYFQSSSKIIPVTIPAKSLTIETTTFRDRLQPGTDETWSFEIKGDGKEKAEAELLASMYDASLDQFKPHHWSFNPLKRNPYRSYSHSNAYQSFGTQHFVLRNLPNRYFHTPKLYFDRLNWFGFSIGNSRYAHYQYLQQLKATYTSKVQSQNDPSKKSGYIYGTVTDSQGQALPGVNVTIKGSTIGTITDRDGNYSILADIDDELVFSFIGMETVTTKVGKDNIVNVGLADDVQALSEVVVTGYATQKKRDVSAAATINEEIVFEEAPAEMALQGKAAGVAVRGFAALNEAASLYVVDGVIVDALNVPQEDILAAEVLQGEEAVALYGARAAGGVMVITTKAGQKKLDQELVGIKARTNFKETVFFFPHLTTDKDGNVSFNFTTPEALTRWKLQLLAHDKNLASQIKTLQTVTQKDLMVIPNPPRFLRQGDEIIFSSKISNLSSENLEGVAALQLFDAITEEPVDELFGNQIRNKNFNISAKGNTEISWKLKIPEDIDAIQYHVVAKAGDFNDGEQNVLPVLTNRMLVTETMPMNIRSDETKTFTLEKLKNTTSPTLKHHQLTMEVTSNPAWYAIQALPYLIEFPYECSEQTFARYYANLIGNHIVTSNPKIKEVFDQWKSAEQLISNLEKNEELKSIIIQETPWLRDAQSETEQKQRMAALFDLSKMEEGLEAAINKLEQMQMSSGGFPWFAGSRYPNRYITQHITAGFGHLKHLGISANKGADRLIKNALNYLDQELLKDYEELLKLAAESEDPDFLDKQHVRPIHIHYLYMRSFFPETKVSDNVQKAKEYYEAQAREYWTAFSLYMKGMIALVNHRSGDEKTATAILRSLHETSIQSEELGMYWKSNQTTWWWNEAPIETQALMIEAFSEISKEGEERTKTIDELKIWLLKNKQTNQWNTTKATTEAVYALLLEGTDWLSIDDAVTVNVGTQQIVPDHSPEAGTGYFKTKWTGEEVKAEMAEVTLTKKEDGIAWGALYWQYFEDLDKITSAETPLKLAKKLFVVKNTDRGEVLTAVEDTTTLKSGNLVRVRIELRSDRDMEFVHMKDMRASGLEPVDVLSEYKWQDGLGYYQSTKDASTNFFFDFLRKGVYVFEYDLRVNNKGNFSNGLTTIQCMYAPEFSSHSEGVRIEVE